MKERPIIMQAESVRSILEGRKAQTRRVIKPQPLTWNTVKRQPFTRDDQPEIWSPLSDNSENVKCPYGVPGDRLWVKESWAMMGEHAAIHQASNSGLPVEKWKSPMFMPRWASRITLEITDVRVQRVGDISEQDAVAEGAELDSDGFPMAAAPLDDGYDTATEWYADLWDSINGKKHPWSSNPWVWAISFRRV